MGVGTLAYPEGKITPSEALKTTLAPTNTEEAPTCSAANAHRCDVAAYDNVPQNLLKNFGTLTKGEALSTPLFTIPPTKTLRHATLKLTNIGRGQNGILRMQHFGMPDAFLCQGKPTCGDLTLNSSPKCPVSYTDNLLPTCIAGEAALVI